MIPRVPSMIVVVLAAVGASAALGEEPFADMKYEEALKAAKKADKVVLIEFYTTWCVPCKEMDKTTWKDKKVRKWLAGKTIPLKVDAEKSKDLAKKLKIESYPTIVLLKPDETEIDRLVGYRDAETFLSEVKAALGGKDSVARAKERADGDKKNDPMARLEYARALARKGDHEEALKEFLWCFDRGSEHGRGFDGLRLSFLLSDIVNLGRKYPPALEELRTRRDQAEKTVRASLTGKRLGPGTGGFMPAFDAVTEAAAINRVLNEEEKTLALFDDLCKHGSKTADLRRPLLNEVLDALLEARRYRDIMDAVGDMLWEVDQSVIMYEATVRRYEGKALSPAPYMKKRALQTGGKYYEAALGAKKLKTAGQIAKKLVKFEKSGETYAMLIDHAVRARRWESARKLVKQAEKALPKEEMAEVRAAAKKIRPAKGTPDRQEKGGD